MNASDARRIPPRLFPTRAGRGGRRRFRRAFLALLVLCLTVSTVAAAPFEPVSLRIVLPEASGAVCREALFRRAVARGWLHALELALPRLPGSFPENFGLAPIAAASDFFLEPNRVCEPAEAAGGLELDGAPSMCRLRPDGVTLTLRALPDAGARAARLQADTDRALAWRRLLQEAEEAARRVDAAADTESLRAAASALEALLGDVRRLLLDASDGWLAGAQDMPRLEELVAAAPESALARLMLAEARLRAGLPQQCVEAASAALRLAPDLARARYVRALAHWRLQQPALAEEDLDAALRAAPAPVGSLAHDGRRRDILRARGALRMLRGNEAGMCEDLTAACALGDCEGLVALRGRGRCLPPDGAPETFPEAPPPRLPVPEGVEARRDVPLWPPVTPETARAASRVVPVRVRVLPDPFVFSPRP